MIEIPEGTRVFFMLELTSNSVDSSKLPFALHNISDVVFHSEPISNDIEAIEKIQDVVDEYCPQSVKMKLAYSPAHYGVAMDLSKQVEYDAEGNVESIGGFRNPLELVAVLLEDKRGEPCGFGVVKVDDFEFTQTMDEIISNKITLH
jgi:hypothetical protein